MSQKTSSKRVRSNLSAPSCLVSVQNQRLTRQRRHRIGGKGRPPPGDPSVSKYEKIMRRAMVFRTVRF